MQPAGRRQSMVTDINVTPMADIMIVLLIIFMVATPYIAQAPVALPAAAHATERPPRELKVAVRANGGITVDGEASPGAAALRDALRARLAASGPVSIVIQADRQADYAQVARVLDACRRAGVEEVGLAAQPLIVE